MSPHNAPVVNVSLIKGRWMRSPSRLRGRLFHLWFLLSRPMTLGARAVVFDTNRRTVLLVRHTYVPGWHLPGGGVEPGETVATALERELREEGNIELLAPPELKAVYFNSRATRRDHVVLYLVLGFRQTAPRLADREIAEADFFPLDDLPAETGSDTRRRIDEIFNGRPVEEQW